MVIPLKIAVDKDSYKVAENDGNSYIYLYDDEDLDFLMSTKLHCVEYSACDYVDINLTKYNIDCMKRCSIDDEDWKYLPDKINYKIGIIIPNYNYEHTIEKCLNSILDQTYKNYQIVFIDDCSTDNSVEIVRKIRTECFPKKNIDIVQLKQKRYNGGARNEGYLYLDDDVDYVYYIDSDDWLYDNRVLERINDKLQSKPDVLFVGLVEYRNGRLKVYGIPEYRDKYEAMNGWSGSCGKVIKKGLATRQECLYNEGTLKEDKNQHCKICMHMNSFALLKRPCYVWNRENSKSVTTIRGNNPLWDVSTIKNYADALWLYLTEKGKDERMDMIMEQRLNRCMEEIKEGKDRQW